LADNIDPVTTVYRRASTATDLTNHIRHHGGLTHQTSLQHFRDNGSCVEGEIGLADEGGTSGCFPQLVCGSTRWHVRGNINSRSDPQGGVWASLTPHWDSSDGSPADACGHIVRPVYDGGDNYSGSGFDAGKDWFWWQTVQVGGHHFEGAQYWDNRLTNVQCNGEETGSNGWVNVIHAR
jgi:hypothetical protein